jgi:small nuclear ribonucleoprotein
LIKFKDDKLIRGILNGYDNHMNIVLNNAVEIQDKNTTDLGTIVVRGDNIIFISPSTS